MKHVLALIFAVISFTSFSQDEKLNQFDKEGKKHGKWILYLDKFGGKADSAHAEFYRFTWYDHGVHLQPMGHFINRYGKITKDNQPIDLSGPLHLLDGEYKCTDKDNHLKFIHHFNNGDYVFYKEFYATGEVQSHFDYTKHAEGQPRSWLLTVYKKDGSIQYQEMIKKDENGKWPKMKG